MSEAVFQPIEDEASAAAARYAIEQRLLPRQDDRWELRVEETHILTLDLVTRDNYAFTVEWGKLIFACWDEQRSQNWRVVSYALTDGEISLRATRGWGHALTSLVLRQPARWQAAQVEANLPLLAKRQAFAVALPQWLKDHFPPARVLRVVNSQRRQSLAAIGYTKITLRIGSEITLALGVSAAEKQTTIDALVATGLVWLADYNQTRTPPEQARRLLFCVPHERATTVIERLTFLDATHLQARVECVVVNERAATLAAVRLATQAELLNTHSSALHWPRERPLADEQRRWVERITQLAPAFPELIELRAVLQPSESVRLLWHGLEFASVNVSGRAEFGVAGWEAHERRPLTEQNLPALQTLLNDLWVQRSAQADDRRHPLYRLRAEAWLESLLRRDITALDATLDDRYVYSQIPAWQAEDRSVLDLLTVTHTGRLAVIEIKASEDAQLPLQGLDYWWRVEQARSRGELAARGLFPGITLAAQAPLLYLVAPRLRFHRSFATVTQCLSPEIEAYRIGLNTNWRNGIRVLTRERINATARTSE